MPANLDATFAALADPTRRAILARLAQGEAPVKELLKPFDISAPAISRHLKVLEDAGLITRSRAAQSRPCRLAVEPLNEVVGWVEQHRALWTERFSRLDAFLQKVQSERRKGTKHGRKARRQHR
jgi:DNA-binding transcriptional ArsR family regulator